MSTLIITLPNEPASPPSEYDFVLDAGTASPAAHGRCPAVLLPQAIKPAPEVVALVPAQLLSWHQVVLPSLKGQSWLRRASEPQRLRAVLAGLLEEQLLDEPEQLHFATFPGATSSESSLVAVCQRDWLHGHLTQLAAAGHHVTRVLPEFGPVDAGQPAQITLTTTLQPAEVVLATNDSVLALPLNAAAQQLCHRGDSAVLQAEPAVADLAERAFERAPAILSLVQHRLQVAAHSSWNLAQFDLTPSSQARLRRQLTQLGQTLWRSPSWRPVRWSLLTLLLVQLLGLNALAWKHRSELADGHNALRHALLQAFPQVSLVIDPVAQMEREVAALQQASGRVLGGSLPEVLMQLALLAPHYQPLDVIEADGDTVKLKGPPLAAGELDALAGRLGALGWSARLDNERLLITLKPQP